MTTDKKKQDEKDFELPSLEEMYDAEEKYGCLVRKLDESNEIQIEDVEDDVKKSKRTS